MSDLHRDMWRVPWAAEGKSLFRCHGTAADGSHDEKSQGKENTSIYS